MHFHRLTSSLAIDDHPSAAERILRAQAEGAGIAASDLAGAAAAYVAASGYMPKQEVSDWLAGLLGWHDDWRGSASAIAGEVLEALLVTGVFGIGFSFGQTILLPRPARHVLVPGVGPLRIASVEDENALTAFPKALFCGSRSREDMQSFADVIGHSVSEPEQMDELRQLVSEARRGLPLRDAGADWKKRLIALTCGFDPAKVIWKIEPDRAAAVLDWAGIGPDATPGQAADPDQLLVMCLPADARVVVTAGPGSGKTQVVCQRISHLIEEGVAATRMWLLSFTKVAVEEMRERIGETLTQPAEARSLNVATFDAFAGHLLRAALPAGAARPDGFDASIRAARAILETRPPELTGYIANLKHVIIDEAQDLLGDRLHLMRVFLSQLPASCGVTILGDAAQSIYNFNKTGRRDSLLDRDSGFVPMVLGTDHRTRDPKLARFFAATREMLVRAGIPPEEKYAQTRSAIESLAIPAPRGIADPVVPVGLRTMVLFRSRGALLSESHRLMAGHISFRLRPTAHGDLIRPWVGALLAGLSPGTQVSSEELADRIGRAAPVLVGLTENVGDDNVLEGVWHRLNQLADSPGARLDLGRLRRRLDLSLPTAMLRRFLGNAGPLLSTIHGAKGLEADHVLLMLPYVPDARQDWVPDRPYDHEEEARVLYVGATRARDKLYIASQRASRMQRTQQKRNWRGRPADFSVEVGLSGDVLPVSPDPEALILAAGVLAAPGPSPKGRSGVALKDAGTARWFIFGADARGIAHGPPLGRLSDEVMAAIGGIAGRHPTELPSRIGGFFLSGAATCTWTDGDEHGIALVPVLCGLASVALETGS